MISSFDDGRPVAVRHRVAVEGGLSILFTHGLAMSDTVWDRCLEALPAEYDVWSARLPWRGEGLSEWGRRSDLTGWLRDALAAVPRGPQVVVAHSMSANVLLELLDRDGADRYGIRAVILVCPFYRGDSADFDWETISTYFNDFKLILEAGIHAQSGGRLPRELQRAMAERVRDRVGPYGWVRFFDLYLRTPELRTDRIFVPCLVLAGADDFAAPAAEAAALAAALPGGELRVLPASGHFPMIEVAERFRSEILAFVNHSVPWHGNGPSTSPEFQR